MIIGLTVHDNDYQDLLVSFGKAISDGDFVLEPPPKEDSGLSRTKVHDWYDWWYKIQHRCIEAAKKPQPSEDDRQAMAEALDRSWKYYVGKRKKGTAEYLKDRLEITFPAKIDDTWSNGEQLYVFPTSYAGKLLLF